MSDPHDDESVGILVTGLAHEVRNALFGLAATLDALELRFGENAEQAPYVSVLRDQGNRIAILIRNLLEYASPYTLRLAPACVGDLMHAAAHGLESLAEERAISLVVDVEPGIPPIPLDRLRVVQVFREILENALHHGERGTVVLVRATRAERDLEVRVEDEGPGFSEVDLAHVFEPFFSRRRGGSGLGLAISRRVILEHRGTISVSNRPEGGALIVVRIPMRTR